MPVNKHVPIIASYKEPWSLGGAFEHFYRFSLDLAKTGASAAIARTATAPLERAKVSCGTSLASQLTSLRFMIGQLPISSSLKRSRAHGMQILMQVSPMTSRPEANKYRSAWDALKRIPQREGWMVSY